MTSILLVQKGGEIKQTKVKNLTEDILYKKCGFRKQNDFGKRTTWVVTIDNTKYTIELWARDNGQANTENKYDFPPPVDTKLYFGTCCLLSVNTKDNTYIDLISDQWNKIYEKLFGGFENLDSEEEMSEDELENIPTSMKTKNGYLKDGFVVDDVNDIVEEEEEEEEDEEDELNIVINNPSDEEEDEDELSLNEDEENEDSDDGSELMEEPYEYSDED